MIGLKFRAITNKLIRINVLIRVKFNRFRRIKGRLKQKGIKLNRIKGEILSHIGLVVLRL